MYYCTKAAEVKDIPRITEIYNQGIEDRIATLETSPKTEATMQEWLISRNERHKVLVIEDKNGCIYGWASLNTFNSRCCYSGVADFSIYIERSARGKGIGKMLLKALMETAEEQGFHKLVLSALSRNEAGKRLYRSAGFREVGTYINQGILDGNWIDVTIMEKLLTTSCCDKKENCCRG